MKQSVQQTREQDTPKERSRKINDLAINFDNRINALAFKIGALEENYNSIDEGAVSAKTVLQTDTIHNLLSSIHGDTITDNCVRGDIITGQSSPATWQRLARGAVGTVLMSTATDIDWVVLPVFTGFANPTTQIGLAVVNGIATTAMRSDAAPALSQAITPTWTGMHNFSNITYSALFTGGNVGIKTLLPNYDLDIAGSIGIDDYLHHNDDPNTYLYFSTDRIMGLVGGKWLIDMNTVAAQDYVKIGDGTDVDINLNDNMLIDGLTRAITLSAYGLGIIHSSAAGLLSSSAIVAADITNNTITNTQLANLGTLDYHAKFGATGLSNSLLNEDANNVLIGTGKCIKIRNGNGRIEFIKNT